MESKRIIPCLDVDKGKVVKGRKSLKILKKLQILSTLAKNMWQDGADELVFYDITASTENRPVFLESIATIAKEVPILRSSRPSPVGRPRSTSDR